MGWRRNLLHVNPTPANIGGEKVIYQPFFSISPKFRGTPAKNLIQEAAGRRPVTLST
jgi:hypothetical protein